MNKDDIMDKDNIVGALENHMPLAFTSLSFPDSSRRFGLILVDLVNGFATVGAGNLAPPAPDAQISRMISESTRLARLFTNLKKPVLAFLDTHEAEKPEPPYPPHCIKGTGEENLVPELEWLEKAESATLMRKDCIDGFIGAFDKKGRNKIVDWVAENAVTDLLVTGICTDICVMDFVLTTLSARNHDMLPGFENLYVYEPGCATYDLDKATAEKGGLPSTAAHPQNISHYMGLYFMASRGALLVKEIAEI